MPIREEVGFLRQNWHIYSWEQHRFDYKIIYPCLLKSRNVEKVYNYLNQANYYLLPGHGHIFDGTVNSIRYLYENKHISLDFMDDGGLSALLKQFAQKPYTTIPYSVPLDKNSAYALACKTIVINFYLGHRKFFITKSNRDYKSWFQRLAKTNASELAKLDPMDISRINTTWLNLVANQPWNIDEYMNLSDFIWNNLYESFIEGTGLNIVFKILQPMINEVAKEFIPEYTRNHPSRMAVRYAGILVFYNSIDNAPSDIKPELDIPIALDCFGDFALANSFTKDMQPQKWFVEHFIYELSKRVKLIGFVAKQQSEMKSDELSVYKYLPVYEYFRFADPHFLKSIDLYMPIFRSNEFTKGEKDEIAKHIVFSIQKAFLDLNTHRGKLDVFSRKEQILLNSIKETLDKFLLNVIRPLINSVIRNVKGYESRSQTSDDVKQVGYFEAIIAILQYDETKNESFFGYMKSMLILMVKSELRQKEIDKHIVDESPDFNDIDFSVPEDAVETDLGIDILKALEQLAPKERKAIEKYYMHNEEISDTERRAKNRGLEKLKKNNPHLKELLSQFA
ncbi:MAG: hypothetical protein GF393_12960 [Armatimonadia bacterium]|nr:hypothetical protein [Armatimonadia bacterium]